MYRARNDSHGLVRKGNRATERLHNVLQGQPGRRRHPVIRQRVRVGQHVGGAQPGHQVSEEEQPPLGRQRLPPETDRVLLAGIPLLRGEGSYDPPGQITRAGTRRELQPSGANAEEGDEGGRGHGARAVLRVDHVGFDRVLFLRQPARDRTRL